MGVGFILGILAIIIGSILGILLITNVDQIINILKSFSGIELLNSIRYFLEDTPLDPQIKEIIAITVITMIICLLSTIYPAIKAAGVLPAKSLKYE